MMDDSSKLWKRAVAEPFADSCVRLDYCCYSGPGYRKRTRIATNATWSPRALCDPQSCPQCVDGKHLVTAQRGPGRGKDPRADRMALDTLHGLPRKLTEEILKVCEAAQWTEL